ncbi:MAG TPA: pseudouridine synthase [Vicinamibacterales bacterium]|nr:pseudouridine synthase [Vicinamibacterales bacterium]
MATTGNVSLERALSKLGLASRSEARALILAGRVQVNGRHVTDPSARVTPERIAIEIDGEPAAKRSPSITIALHKPRGYVTTRSDPEGRKTVYDLLADVPRRVVPVGRLDLATSGLLLFTNDTQFANWLTDPANAIPRVYLVTVEGRVDDTTIATLQHGITIEGERLAAHSAVIRKASGKESHLTLTLIEGKNREVRRLLEAVGHPVRILKRVQFGGLSLGDLATGKWRKITDAELLAAFPGYTLPSKRVPRVK